MTFQSIIRYDRRRPGSRAVGVLVRHLEAGHLAVVPSDTEYALCGDATSGRAVQAARALKGRDARQPFSIFLRDAHDVVHRRIRLTGYAAALAGHYWPGPMTLVLPARSALAGRLGSRRAMGVRVSAEPIITQLLKHLRRPLIATSANPSGAVFTTSQENRWLAEMAGAGLLIWARPHRYIRRPASTVIDCTRSAPKLLRDGAISRGDWQRIVARDTRKSKRR